MREGLAIHFKSVLTAAFLLASTGIASSQAAATPQQDPRDHSPPAWSWIDPDTGHRVIRLTGEINSHSLPFDKTAFTPDGLDMIYEGRRGIYDLNLATLKTSLLVSGAVNDVVVGTKSRRVFFRHLGDAGVSVLDIDTKVVKKMPTIPFRGELSSVNADETLLVGTVVEDFSPTYNDYYVKAQAAADPVPNEQKLAVLQAMVGQVQAGAAGAPAVVPPKTSTDVPWKPVDQIANEANAAATEMRFAAHSPEDIFTYSVQTGEVKIILKGTDWVGHVRFSPTDPEAIVYAHEGPVAKVDRVWTIRSDGSHNHMVQTRVADGAVANEFWSRDGKTIWFDAQKSEGGEFNVIGLDVANGNKTSYKLKKDDVSIHYNVSYDGSVFCGDGYRPMDGDHGVSRKWIEVLRPAADGTLQATRLVGIPDQKYWREEPNARFSPDGTLVIYSSNTSGLGYIYAVEVAKAPRGEPVAGGQ